MRIIKALLIALSIISLFSCASSPADVKYYSLSLTSSHNVEHKNKKYVVIEPIHLAAFLQQDGLVMQMGEHEIYTASYHRWAEPLDEAIGRLLTQELNTLSSHYYFETSEAQWHKKAKYHLRLNFSRFQATDHATVSVAGHYGVYLKGSVLKFDQTFLISDKLKKDGYLYSVEKLKQAVHQLATQIITAFNRQPNI